MAYSKAVASAITAYFNERGWQYEFNEEKGTIKSSFNLNNKLEGYTQTVHLDEEEYLVWSIFGIVEERYRREVTKLIARVNYTYIAGYLTLDMKSGHIMHCYHEYYKNRILSDSIIGQSLNSVESFLGKYGNALYAVMNGELSAKAAFDTVNRG